MLTAPPLALYVHLPWCARKCPYCDFNSHQPLAALPEKAYVAQLLADLDADLPLAGGRALVSIFIGGGTPSLFSAEAISVLLAGIRARMAIADRAEITLEANPGSAEAAKFAGFRAAGVTRLSIGVQSFSAESLRLLGRIHDPREAHAAIGFAQAAGFERINVDLMHGLPGQTVDEAMADIDQALDHGLAHLSWYQLTVEPNTVFHSAPPELPPEDVLAAIQERGFARLAAAGLAQYEVSAFARPGHRSVHNRNYWEFGDYIGIGAGAHGKLSDTAKGSVLRTWKTRTPKDYLGKAASGLRSERVVDAEELPLEFLMNALRLREGVPAHLFGDRTGLDVAMIGATLDALRRDGLLVDASDRLCTTPLGYRFLDSVLERFTDD